MPIVNLCTAHVDCVNRTAPVVNEPTPFKMIRTTNVDGGFVDVENVRYVSEEVYKRWTRRLVPRQGDIILTREAPLGDVGKLRTDDSVFLGQRLYHFRPDPEKLDEDFLLYSLLDADLQAQIRSFGSGSTVEHMRLADIPKLAISVPDLAEQRRISSVLAAYDALIENNRRRIVVVEEMARALFREWFVHFRYPGDSPRSFTSSPLGEIPEGWHVRPLEAVCERITDGAHASPPSVDEGYPMASVRDMRDWGLDLDGCRRISAQHYTDLVRNNCKPQRNDVLIAKDGSYLKHTFVVGADEEVVILSSIALLRPNSAITSNFLSFTLREPGTKARMAGYVSGVAIPRIILKDFKQFLILVPPPEIQLAWEAHVGGMVDLCRLLVSQVGNLRRTRGLLLPRLLSGDMSLLPATF